jgi:hypothetical protein
MQAQGREQLLQAARGVTQRYLRVGGRRLPATTRQANERANDAPMTRSMNGHGLVVRENRRSVSSQMRSRSTAVRLTWVSARARLRSYTWYHLQTAGQSRWSATSNNSAAPAAHEQGSTCAAGPLYALLFGVFAAQELLQVLHVGVSGGTSGLRVPGCQPRLCSDLPQGEWPQRGTRNDGGSHGRYTYHRWEAGPVKGGCEGRPGGHQPRVRWGTWRETHAEAPCCRCRASSALPQR